MKILRTSNLGSNFTGSYKRKECNGGTVLDISILRFPLFD